MKTTRYEIRDRRYENIRCVILAAGLGTRMNTNLPKALHKIGNEMMLERLIETVKSSGISHIVVVVGYGSEQVEDILKKYNINTIRQNKLLGSADAVKAAKRYFTKFTGSLLVLYTDTPLIRKATLKGLINRHRRSGAACTLLAADVNSPTGYGRVIRDSSGDIVKIVEEKDATVHEKDMTQINVGAYCFKRKELFDVLARIKKNPKKGEFYLTDIIKHFRDRGMPISSYDKCSEEEALGINSREDLSAAEKIIRMRKIKQLMEGGVTFIDPETAYIDKKVKIAKDTVVYPSVVIQGEVIIGKNCRIGPFAKIRGKTEIDRNCVIGNFVEVVRSKIGENTKVKHHVYLGDAYVGNDVNIGAGAITANYDGKRKNRTTIKSRAFIGVGAILIAPVKIGEQAVVGAGSVVTKNKDVPDKATVIGVPARVLRKK
ncbi:MAG: bifunctional N-acetylglucosamine-1-phosphate uridyltransferase/glucosamine-1-phosphate acetyltransferase [Candidatus Omnitrophota bacterium]|nr:MAG: bifunctional N-acetylglucosamine-1-phosphate uridyltransferase/glucosamine-1-phosphate acetyltransferase [Candidatus Omnitrophota bacterium]